MDLHTLERHLERLQDFLAVTRRELSQPEVVAVLTVTTAAINAGVEDADAADLLEEGWKKALERYWEIVQEMIARYGPSSYQVSLGSPTISLSLTWEGRKGRARLDEET
jgi:hypothetical protein